MNVFDFDKTVYPNDSTADFIVYIALHHPWVIAELIKGLPTVVAYKRGRVTKTAMKQKLFVCFSRVPDIDSDIKRFWDKRIKRIEGWYLNMKTADDVIISASPEFLLSEACARLGIKNLIASRVDKKNGEYTGENCYGEEKIRRFKERFPDAEIDAFYSDSYSDVYMARLAKTAYKIDGKKASPWKKERL